MNEGSEAPDLGPLHDRYDIIGELRGSGDTRCYVGRRRQGGGEVVIMVARTPRGDQNNGLSHFAADTKLLTTLSDPRLPRVLEGVWLGNDAYARVTEPIRGTSLAERLSAGEHLANARIATILQAVNGLLDWARDHGVVHRGVPLDTLYFERGGERTRVMLAPMPIPMSGVPDACADAKTIGELAWAMLSGKPFDGQRQGSLAELAPNLAKRVVDATDEIVRCNGDETPDVLGFLSTVGMADALKQAEVELAALKEQYDDEHRRALDNCEHRLVEVEHHAMEQTALLAGEREEFKRYMDDERAAIAAERVEFESAAAERQRHLGEVREQLEAQRADAERRLAELDAHRLELDKYRAEVDAFRKEAERVRSEVDRARKEADRARREAVEARAAAAAALAAAEAKVAEMGESEGPVAGHKLIGMRKAIDRKSTEPAPNGAQAAEAALPPLPPMPELPAVPAVPAVPAMPVSPRAMRRDKKPEKQIEKMFSKDLSSPVTADGGNGRPTWLIPVIALAVFVVLGVIALGINHFRRNANAVAAGKSTIVPASPTVPSGGIPAGGFLTQSAGGSVAPHFSGSPLVNPDSANAAAAGAAPSDSAAAANAAAANAAQSAAAPEHAAPSVARPAPPKPKPASQPQPEPPHAADSFPPDPRPVAAPADTVRRPSDSAVAPVPIRRDSAAPRDTTVRRDTVRPDTVVRRDTLVRRDTIRPDTATGQPTRP